MDHFFFERAHQSSDIDLCLLLDTRNEEDLIVLNKLIDGKHESKVDITVHYLDEIECRGWENFHHGTHGVFFLHHLAHAMLLSGSDIFARKAHQVPTAKYTESLISQVHQYIDRIQTALVNDNLIRIDFYRKYLTRIMIDMMLINSEISYREVNTNSAIDIMDKFINASKIFSAESKKIHRKIMTQDADRKDITLLLQFLTSDLRKLIKQTKSAL